MRHSHRHVTRTNTTTAFDGTEAAMIGEAVQTMRRYTAVDDHTFDVVDQCVVKADGTVGDVEVLRSLDKTFGLDQEAIQAAKAWQFEPGTRNGEPVPVLVTIELTFTLRPSEPMRFELRLAE